MGEGLLFELGNRFVDEWGLRGTRKPDRDGCKCSRDDEILIFLGKVVMAICSYELFSHSVVLKNLSDNDYVKEYLESESPLDVAKLVFKDKSEIRMCSLMNYMSNDAMESFISRCEENGLDVATLGCFGSKKILYDNGIVSMYQRVYAWIDDRSGVSFGLARANMKSAKADRK